MYAAGLLHTCILSYLLPKIHVLLVACFLKSPVLLLFCCCLFQVIGIVSFAVLFVGQHCVTQWCSSILMPKVTYRLTRSSRASTASRRTRGDNHTRGHTSRHHRSSSASRSISSDSSFSMALPSSQAVSSAVSATPAQLTLLEDVLFYIRAEVQHTVSQSTSIAATHDASPPPSSQHSSLPQPQPASVTGVSVGVSYMYTMYICIYTMYTATCRAVYFCCRLFCTPCMSVMQYGYWLHTCSGTCIWHMCF